MPKRLVRHALVTYVVDGRQEMAFRGQTVDLSQEEAERFDDLGATIPEGAELDRPGTLGSLPESPTDEELIAWVIAATDGELRATLAVRPELGPRIEGARTHLVDAREYQVEQLTAAAKSASGAPAVGYLKKTLGSSAMLEEGQASASHRPTGTGDVGGPAGVEGGDTPGDTPTPGSGPADPGPVVVSDPNEGTPNTTAEVEAALATEAAATADEANVSIARAVVRGSVEDVTGFVADNPELAEVVLDAEIEARAAQNKEPRAGVVRAAEAALGHTQ